MLNLPPIKGAPGQSWRTGTGAWFLKAIAYYIFGLQPEMEGLRLNPCLPPEWKNCSVCKIFRGTEYIIRYVTTQVCNQSREYRRGVLPGAP